MDYLIAILTSITLLGYLTFRYFKNAAVVKKNLQTPSENHFKNKQLLMVSNSNEDQNILKNNDNNNLSMSINSETKQYYNIQKKTPKKIIISNYDRIKNNIPKYFDVCLWLTNHKVFKSAQIMNRWRLSTSEVDAILFELKENNLISELKLDGFYHVYDNNENVFRSHFEQLKLTDFEYIEEEKNLDPKSLDTLFTDAARIIVLNQQGSTSLLQRKLNLGYNRAGRLIEQMEKAGIVAEFKGSKAREVLIFSEVELENLFKKLNLN